MSRCQGGVFMRKFRIVLAVICVSGLLAAVRPVSADEPEALKLEKECVVMARIQGADVELFPIGQKPGTDQPLKDMVRVRGFELLNRDSGDWQPLSLSEEGYFCANVRMGRYDLRGRDCEGRPYLIYRFNVPLNMAVNLGTFLVETCHPDLVTVEFWHDYFRTASWREYREGEGRIALRLKHDASKEAYEDCENWFAGCYEAAYEHFKKLIARR